MWSCTRKNFSGIQEDLKLLPIAPRDILSLYYQNQWVLSEEAFVPFYLLTYENLLGEQAETYLADKYPHEVKLSNQKSLLIHYSTSESPFLSTYIQDFYGVKDTPVMKNGQKLVLKLIGPHKRPVQVTNDLARFWNKTYPDLLKEFNREYPRHFWPPNPSEAKPFLLLRQAKA